MEFFKGVERQFLKIKSDKIEEYVHFINVNNIENISVNRAWGYSFDNIDFIKKCKYLKAITIVDPDIKLEGLESCLELEYLQCESVPTSPIDLSKFTNLKEFRGDYSKNWSNLSKCENLEILALWKYTTSDLSEFSNLKRLRKLELVNTKITNFSGISELFDLRELFVVNAKNLAAIGNDTSLTISKIKIENAKHLQNLEMLVNYPNLKDITLIKCGDIQSVDFLSKLNLLEGFSIEGMNILDGEIDILKNIKQIYFEQKKHYSFNCRDYMLAKLGKVSE